MNVGDRKTEKILKAVKRDLKSIYKDAYTEFNGRFSDFIEEYDKQYAELKKGLENEELSREQYKAKVKDLVLDKKRFKDLLDEITNIAVEHNAIAGDIINRSLHEVFEINANYTAYQIEKLYSATSFSLVPKMTIEELSKGYNHVNFRTVSHNRIKDYIWNERRITDALTQGIIQGDSVNRIANRFLEIMGKNYDAAVRNARTSITSAQNAGKQSTFEKASEMGIELEKEWIATSDGSTRDSHAELDGVRVPYNSYFPNGLIYPCDPKGDPSEVYNCRCTMRAIIPDINDEARTENDVDSYNEWLKKKREEQWL